MDKLQVEKGRSGAVHTLKEKIMVLNVFKYLRQQHPEHSVSQVVRETSKATGCSEGSIYKFRKEESSVEGLKEPSKKRQRKNAGTNSRDMKYNEDVRQAIRVIVEGCTNIGQSLNSVLMVVNADSHLPHFTRATLRRLLLDMGIKYKRIGNRSVQVKSKFTGSRKRSSNKESMHTAAIDFVDTNPILFTDIDKHLLYDERNLDEYMEEISDDNDTKPLLVEIEQKPIITELSHQEYCNTAMAGRCNNNSFGEIDQKPVTTVLDIGGCYEQQIPDEVDCKPFILQFSSEKVENVDVNCINR